MASSTGEVGRRRVGTSAGRSRSTSTRGNRSTSARGNGNGNTGTRGNRNRSAVGGGDGGAGTSGDRSARVGSRARGVRRERWSGGCRGRGGVHTVGEGDGLGIGDDGAGLGSVCGDFVSLLILKAR